MPDERPKTKKRVLVIVPHEGSGIVTPFLEEAKKWFSLVDVIYVQLPRWYKFLQLVISFHPVRKKWYERWKHRCEKKPYSFKVLSKLCESLVGKHIGVIDGIIQFGTVHSLGNCKHTVPYVIVTDSTRRLSAANPADSRSHFKKEKEATEWYRLEGAHYRGATSIICRSSCASESMIRDYGVLPEKVEVINFGVGGMYPSTDSPKRYDGKTVLFVGKGNLKKRVEM